MDPNITTAAAKGHTLGGVTASADEVRERRVAALGTGGGTSQTTSNLKSPPASGGNSNSVNTNCSTNSDRPVNVKQTWFVESEGANEDDVELQAALALSLGKPMESTIPMQAAVSPAVVVDGLTADKAPSQANKKVSSGEEKRVESYDDLIGEWWKSGDPFSISSFHEVMWDSGMTTDNDKSRWVGQGIDFRNNDTIESDPDGEASSVISLLAADYGPWGLTQSHGGPCGVLAAVQAELLRILLFGQRNPVDYPRLQPGTVPKKAEASFCGEDIRQALAKAIAIVLARSANMPSAASNEDVNSERKTVGIVLPSQSADASSLTWEDLEPWSTPPDSHVKSAILNTYRVAPKDLAASSSGAHKRQKIDGSHESRADKILRMARATAAFLLHDGPPGRASPLEAFRKPGGVMLLVMSLVATRGRGVIQSEMDDPTGTRLTAQFGHCGQELINLLLTGQAVSNVFDNTLTPSGELTCRGIQSRPDLGYLSQLEALRYCEVGGYYKSPNFPIWVVGSTSHFTVLFGDSSCLKESDSDILLERCRRAFKAVEGGEENGFISSSVLKSVLKSLGLDLGGDHLFSALAAALEVSDAGIILWDDFWKATSRLMTGASIEQVLNNTPVVGANGGRADDGPPLLITQHGEPMSDQDIDKKPAGIESDEEMAKRLSSQWELESSKASSSAAAAAAAAPSSAASPMEVEPAALSDEELARKLQAEWDAEVSGPATSSVVAVNGSPGSPQWNNFPDTNSSIATPDMTPMSAVDDSNPQDTKDVPTNLEFEKYGDSFQLFHYNGLRGGTLTPLRVTRLTAEEAVGASIALSRGNNAHLSGSGDLESVVRTKWPSSMINWLGKSPPYID